MSTANYKTQIINLFIKTEDLPTVQQLIHQCDALGSIDVTRLEESHASYIPDTLLLGIWLEADTCYTPADSDEEVNIADDLVALHQGKGTATIKTIMWDKQRDMNGWVVHISGTHGVTTHSLDSTFWGL